MKAKIIAITLIAVTAATIAVVAVHRIVSARIPHVQVDRAVYPVRGIDISAHNGTIDFDRVAKDSVRFVYIKASEGATWRDPRFNENYDAAVRAGLKVGVYHFFRFDVPGWRQSVNVLGAIDRRHIDLPIAIDVEDWGNPGEYSREHIIGHLRTFVQLLRLNGREPIIYTNKTGYSRYVYGNFDDVSLWICSFTTPPIATHNRWHLWQHSHRGHVDGVEGNVDLCTFNTRWQGDFEKWLRTNPAITRLSKGPVIKYDK